MPGVRPIITSLLDTDMYTFTVGQMVFWNYPELIVGYEFVNRGYTPFPEGFANKLRVQIEMMADLSLKREELEYLNTIPYLRKGYVEWFSSFRFDPSQVTINQLGASLEIKIQGPWRHSIFWEVPLLALISELYQMEVNRHPDEEYTERAEKKGVRLLTGGARFADFGTRRRFSKNVHEQVLIALIRGAGPNLLGTSNLEFAMKYELTPMGTQSHQLYSVLSALYGPQGVTRVVLEEWNKIFNGNLGNLLPDTFTTDVFLRDFGLLYARASTGLRQDSGDPKAFTDKVISHYLKLGINPVEEGKGIVFSDALGVARAIDLVLYTKGKIKCMFGIGTSFTNSVGYRPINIVIKAVSVWRPEEPEREIHVVKLSDVRGKETGDPETIVRVKGALGIGI